MTEDTQVVIGDVEVSLAEIAGVDFTGIAEVRSTVCPGGKFHWRILDAELKAVEAANKDDPQGPKVNKPVVQFELQAQNCFALVDDALDPESYMDIKHFETFWINDVKKDLGRVKAFLVDIGIDGNKPLTDLLAEAHGMEFVSDVTNGKSKNNPDIIYANLKNLMTMEEFGESQGDSDDAPPPVTGLNLG